MNHIRLIWRGASILAGLAAAFAAAPAALAAPRPRPADSPPLNLAPPAPGWDKHPPLPAHAHALAAGGLPGWQITLIAAAAVLAAAATVLLARARAARQRAAASPA
jgi:hypothetical protein